VALEASRDFEIAVDAWGGKIAGIDLFPCKCVPMMTKKKVHDEASAGGVAAAELPQLHNV
jgi:hypothetical protein